MIRLPLMRSFLHSQKGIAQIFVMLLLFLGILGGVFLVQQRTNLMPFAAEECGERNRTGDESKCVKFTITSCEPADGKSSCDVKFEWNTKNGGAIELRVTKEGANSPTYRQVSTSGKTIALERGKYNSVIRWENGDDINPNDKLKFEVGKKGTVSWGSFSSTSASGATKPGSSITPASSASTGTAANAAIHSKVPEKQGDFPKGDFTPRGDKQKILDDFLTGKIKGRVECRNTNAQSNDGKNTGDNEKNASSMWVVPDTATADIAKTGVYIIDCSRSAIGSYKNWETVTCGKIKNGSSYKFGCVDTTLKNASSGGNGSSGSGSGSGNRDSANADSNSQPKATDVPTLTEKQIKDCGFTVTESGVPIFAVQVGGKISSAQQEKTCDDIRAAQLKYFEGAIEKARQEAEEARKNGDTAKADELEKKATEAEKATAGCEGKKDNEFADCAKSASEVVQKVATEAQSQAVTNAYKKMQVLLAQGENSASRCVKADMGVAPFLEAPRLKQKRADKNDEARRLLLCTGADKKFKWRVLIGGKSGAEFADEDGVDEGNDAERIYGLHGTTPDATGAPTYPYTVTGKNCFTIYDPNTEDGIRKTIGKYLDAAKEGKTTMRSPAVQGDTAASTTTSNCNADATTANTTPPATTPPATTSPSSTKEKPADFAQWEDICKRAWDQNSYQCSSSEKCVGVAGPSVYDEPGIKDGYYCVPSSATKTPPTVRPENCTCDWRVTKDNVNPKFYCDDSHNNTEVCRPKHYVN